MSAKAKKSYKKGGKFPDLTGDGKVTMADVLKGRGVGKKKMEKGGKIVRKAKRTDKQASKQTKYLGRKKQLPAQGTKEQLASDYRKRRNKKLTRALMGTVMGSVMGAGEYNVRQRKS